MLLQRIVFHYCDAYTPESMTGRQREVSSRMLAGGVARHGQHLADSRPQCNCESALEEYAATSPISSCAGDWDEYLRHPTSQAHLSRPVFERPDLFDAPSCHARAILSHHLRVCLLPRVRGSELVILLTSPHFARGAGANKLRTCPLSPAERLG